MRGLGTTARRASVITTLVTVYVTAQVTHPQHGGNSPVRASAEVVRSETLLETVQRATDLLGAVPAQPGVPPPFIPSGELVVRADGVRLVKLGTPGAVVAWVR